MPERHFGARERLRCDECGAEMVVVRRTPHRELGMAFELQTFRCVDCGCELSRSVDGDGHAAGPVQ